MSKFVSEDELFQLIKKMNLEQTTSTGKEANAESDQPGQIQIQDNKIIVEVTESSSEYPTIQAVHPVQLIINGKIHSEKTVVSPGDRLDWQIIQEPLFKIEVSENRLEAYFQLIAKVRFGWKLKDKNKQAHMLLEAEEDRSVVVEKLTMADVMKSLQQQKIVKNIHAASIFQELATPTYGRILIAHGVKHEPSHDAKLDIYFSEEAKNIIQENERTNTVDYRNHHHIPSAKKGDLLAKKIPMKLGMIGYDVYGELIKPERSKDITMIAKDHVEITNEGEVYALKDGRPRITGTMIKYFDITTSYVISGDVDLKTGHIVFSGDVVVYGNVTEGMIIESLGNVYVFGNVYQATITATGSIMVNGNIISSNLYSGYYGVIFNRLYIQCKSLNDLLGNLIQAGKLLMSMIESKGQQVKLGQIILTLTESKFKDIPKVTAEILQCIHNVQSLAKDEMEELKTGLQPFLEPIKMGAFQSYNPIYSIQTLVQETFQMIERMQENSSNVDIQQCHISNIKSTGDIIVRKEGVLQSQLFCKGNILFTLREAVCRGCQLEAQGTINAAIVGGEIGGEVSLKAGKRISLQQMNYGRISIGKYSQDILEPVKDLVAYVQHNELIIEGELNGQSQRMRKG